MNDTSASAGTSAGAGAGAAAKPANNKRTNDELVSFIGEIRGQLDSLPGAYRFLYSELRSLNSPYIFVGLNPAGTEHDPKDLFIESGNAIMNEKWGKDGKSHNKLQQQLIYFFQQLAGHLGVDDWIPFMSQDWLISNIVFYKSHDWPEIKKKKAHVNLCINIWKVIFERKTPRVIVCNGFDTYKEMLSILKIFGWAMEHETKSCRAWDGPHIGVIAKGSEKCAIIGFGHLSYYGIVGRPENKECIENVFEVIKLHM